MGAETSLVEKERNRNIQEVNETKSGVSDIGFLLFYNSI